MEAYANGSVEIEEALVGKLSLHTHPESATSLLEAENAGRRGSRSEVKVRLRSAAPLVGGMIAVVLYPESTLYTPTAGMGAGAEIEVRALPDLPAGERVTVEFTARSFSYRQDQSFFVQVFDREGQEVLTNVVRKAWPYYAAVERFKLLDTLQHMRKAGERKDMDPRPVLMIRPLLPENAVLPSGAVFAQLSISPEGTVTEINLDPLESTAFSAALREALGGWLFVPQAEGGRARGEHRAGAHRILGWTACADRRRAFNGRASGCAGGEAGRLRMTVPLRMGLDRGVGCAPSLIPRTHP
jgi:hypothetical protein